MPRYNISVIDIYKSEVNKLTNNKLKENNLDSEILKGHNINNTYKPFKK